MKVTAVTGVLTQFCVGVVGRNATSPATMSPGWSAGLLLDVTLPLIAWLAATPVVVTLATVVWPVLQAIFLLLTLSVIVFNLVADLLYVKLDPRVVDQ